MFETKVIVIFEHIYVKNSGIQKIEPLRGYLTVNM